MISNKDDFQHACGNQSLTWKENGKPRTSGLSLIYHVNFRYSTDILHPAQFKIIAVPEEDWFGQPEYSTP